MRAVAYGGRGARLGDDDRDAAHCHYPHTLTLTSPGGSPAWSVGSVHALEWTQTTEAGPDRGTVDLELSADDGASWSPVVAGATNDGRHDWLVGDLAGEELRLRVVRHHRGSAVPAAYPATCSGDVSDGTVSIVSEPPAAGLVPAGALRIAKTAGAEIRLSWAASCSADADGYAVYAGSLDALRAGTWDLAPVTCAAGTDLVEDVLPAGFAEYYLVAPLAGGSEGGYGASSDGADRLPAAAACATREAFPGCLAGSGDRASGLLPLRPRPVSPRR
jgi:hypothetical protein